MIIPPTGRLRSQLPLKLAVRRKRLEHSGSIPGVTTDQAKRTKELKRENRELKRANDILRKVAAYFAQAELDRKPK
jgi:transposase-like protein